MLDKIKREIEASAEEIEDTIETTYQESGISELNDSDLIYEEDHERLVDSKDIKESNTRVDSQLQNIKKLIEVEDIFSDKENQEGIALEAKLDAAKDFHTEDNFYSLENFSL